MGAELGGPSQQIALSGAVGVRDIADLARQLRELLATPGPLLIDCTAVTEIDLSAVQVLVAAHRSALAGGRSLALRAPIDGPLCRLLKAAGFLGANGTPLTPEAALWSGAGGKAA